MLARVVKNVFNRLGYEVRPIDTAGWHTDTSKVAKPGFDPRVVVDVGVGFGTPDLYAAFPKAHFVLLEPLKEFVPNLEDWAKRYSAEYHLTAVGSEVGTQTIHVNPKRIQRSTIETRTALTSITNESEAREIPVTTLDRLLEQHGWTAPFGLKIDAEGFEYRIIQGATRFLAQTQFVIAEISVSQRFRDSYTFADFVALMDERGFRLCDILRGPTKNSELLFVDAIFRRKDDSPIS